MRLSHEQQQRALALIEGVAWGDLDGAMRGCEHALRLALHVTESDFHRWEEVAVEAGFEDEFSLTAAQIESLSDDERDAYVARLLRDVAQAYGLWTELGPGPLAGGPVYYDTIGGIVRELSDVSASADADRPPQLRS